MEHRVDVEYLKPLHTFGKWCGILPCTRSKPSAFKSKLHGLLIISVVLTLFTISTYGRFTFLLKMVPTTLFVTSVMHELSLTFVNMASIIYINLMHSDKIYDFIEELAIIDQLLRQISSSIRYPMRCFYTQLILSITFSTLCLSYSSYVTLQSMGWEESRYHLFNGIQIYLLICTTLILRQYALAIKFRMHYINEILSGVKNIEVLHQLKIIHMHTTRCIEQYNDIFGLIYVAIYVNIVISLLFSVNIALTYGTGDVALNGVYYGIDLFIFCTFWGLMSLALGTSAFNACNATCLEAKRLPNICYRLLYKASELNDLRYIHELQGLIEQIVNSCTEFTAAGFFTIDHKIVFTLVGSISSYLIVLIQFKRM